MIIYLTHRNKLSEERIAALLALKGTVIQQVAADQFGVSRGYVGQLCAGTVMQSVIGKRLTYRQLAMVDGCGFMGLE